MKLSLAGAFLALQESGWIAAQMQKVRRRTNGLHWTWLERPPSVALASHGSTHAYSS